MSEKRIEWRGRIEWRVAIAANALGALVVFPGTAAAQTDTGGAAPAGGGGSASAAGSPGGSSAGGNAGGGASQAQGTQSSQTVFFPGGVAPPPPGQAVGGGNVTESSGKPRVGDEEDSFDLGPGGGSGETAFGSQNGPVFLDNGRGRISGLAPGQVVVKRGDTLWDLCDTFFQNPYQWPRIWSFNPDIQNPHWIYPGEVVKLRPGGGGNDAASGPQDGGGLIDRRRQVRNGTVFLRDEGFVDDASDDNWGEISGAPEDKMFLADFDEVYLRLGGDKQVKLGQELTVFRPIRRAGTGQIVQIQGTVKVDDWNPKEKIARAQVVETLEVIERGARIGPIPRTFDVVPPVRNANDVEAHVAATIQPHEFVGQNQVVFIDRGEKDGLVVGNRLFIVRKGDAWRKSLPSAGAATRIALEKESPAEIERVPTPRRDDVLPEEIVGELRVVAVRQHTATTLVTQARGEIEMGDTAVARKGY